MKQHQYKLNNSFTLWMNVAILLFATLIAPFALSGSQRAEAAQVESRFIALESSAPDAENSYDIEFVVPDPGSAHNVGSVRIEFCDNNPLPGQSCVFDAVGDDIPQVDANAGTIATLNGSPTFGSGSQAVSMTAPAVGDNYLDFTLAAQEDINGDSLVQRTFSVTVDNIDNPDNTTDGTNNNSFYARIYVFSSTTPTAYSQATPPTGVDDGGVAMSTTEQLQITARVQEILEFCIGDTNAAASSTDDCASSISGNDIDMGVLTSGTVNTASAEDSNAYAMTRTNATNGVTISYFADAGYDVNDDGGGGVESGNDINDGHLSKTGADCTTPASTTDACINSVGGTESALTAGTENFGMTITGVDTTAGGTTTNITRDAEYDNDVGYAFVGDNLTADTIATSNTVVDDEALVIDFAGTAAITTPTGIYNTALTFIATATY